MIAYLKGKVLLIDDNEVIVEAGQSGVGYRLLMSANDMSELEEGMDIELHVYTQVREDAFELYGFKSRDERALFIQLISAKGVGSRSALAILNTLTPAQLQVAVLTADVATLKKVPGIGAKTASQIILDLEKWLKSRHFADTLPTASQAMPVARKLHADTRSALKNFGFSEQDIDRVLAKLDESGEDLDVQGEIRWALKAINQK
ncbi:MAG: Holliday junction branch migration protein RuvA [Proteobacteria bacterium]|nr:Holliday junction branch migration protein RuvA [Pseudomonadota bacterium]